MHLTRRSAPPVMGSASPAEPAKPISDPDFAAAMESLGPWGPAPRLAVAVSGGPDSLALCLLADRWARCRNGSIVALTVDHGLRPDSATEARRVAEWMAARSIDHRILTWQADSKPKRAVQAAARSARYRLLEEACLEAGIFFLLLAHSLDDQAETLLMRLSKGSGVDGLAAMATVRETRELRLLRPVLGMEKGRLLETCRREGQDWIEDPSNASERFARGRLRTAVSALAAEGLVPARLAGSARRAGKARAALEASVGRWLGGNASLLPEGVVRLNRASLAEAPEEIALRALARCLQNVGGAEYPPRLERLERLRAAMLPAGKSPGRTLAGCRIIADRPESLLICREPMATETLDLDGTVRTAGAPIHWDARFQVALPDAQLPPGLQLRRLGKTGRAALKRAGLAPSRSPAVALLSLPGLWRGGDIFALPKFVSLRTRAICCNVRTCGVEFVPLRRLTDPAFAVV